MNLFETLNGQVGENIATEVIAYLLSDSKSNAPFQKLFFHKVLGQLVTSVELNAKVDTQRSSAFGRPDMIILCDKYIIVIETKMGSYLSGDNQLIGYAELLSSDTKLKKMFPDYELRSGQKKYLCILAPQKTVEICLAKTESVCKKRFGEDFFEWIGNLGINFVKLSWEDVLADLEYDNVVQRELNDFVKIYTWQELTENEMNLLNDKMLPGALDKMYKSIINLRDQLSTAGYNANRMGQSYQYYGFGIAGKDYEMWFGYSLPTWEELETPIVLQLRTEWIKLGNKTAFFEKASQLGFKKNKSLEMVLPFYIKDIGEWKHRLQEIVKSLDSID